VKNLLLVSIFFFLSFSLHSQKHWESVVLASQTWRYLPATSQPPSTWNLPSFDDSLWKTGVGGFGFGDNDDATVISGSVNSIYLRKKFNIINISNIEQLLLDIDYDDAFILYINGIEVARSKNIIANPPLYNSALTIDREAQLYQNLLVERHVLNTSMLIQGENTLAVQILNNSLTSSDMSALVFLNVKIDSPTTVYQPVPAWFTAPSGFLESNLPIVIINTDKHPTTGIQYEIKDEPKVLASMKIIYNPKGIRNYETDQNNDEYLNYNGRIGIEKRGSSSQLLDKKPYGLTTLKADNVSNNNVSLLGMPKENDWVLNSLAYDASLIRDFLSYEIYKNTGNYAARAVYCEVIINGDYKGLYLLMEKLKIDDNRINISKLTTADNTMPNITGGYITKADKTNNIDPVAWTMMSGIGWTVNFIHDSPKPSEITSQQNNYIYLQFNALKNVMNAQLSSITDGYPSIIDVPSFVDFMLMNEICSNADAYTYSTFFHKERNGKLRAGPIWDFNLTFGNDLFSWGYDRSLTNVWQFDDNENTGAKFWKDLYTNTQFKCYMSKRWVELTAQHQPFNHTVIAQRIDEVVNIISEAAVREQSRWGKVGNHATQISDMKNWLEKRILWLNGHLSSYQTCANITTPALVISKIHYNPLTSTTAVSDSLEFIEISNNSNNTINLTGVYFKELGLTYQFPVNSTIAPNAKIHLTSNPNIFQLAYGFKPFGKYTRLLSNNSEKLTLVDAFGNIIDNVEYSHAAPWPIEADGQGSFLELTNLNSDNSLATSWTASNKILEVENITFEQLVNIYPTPATTSITISCGNLEIVSYSITDLLGRLVKIEKQFNSNTKIINLDQLLPTVYFINLKFSNGMSAVKKIVKQ